jgi:hypothetical protein
VTSLADGFPLARVGAVVICPLNVVPLCAGAVADAVLAPLHQRAPPDTGPPGAA